MEWFSRSLGSNPGSEKHHALRLFPLGGPAFQYVKENGGPLLGPPSLLESWNSHGSPPENAQNSYLNTILHDTWRDLSLAPWIRCYPGFLPALNVSSSYFWAKEKKWCLWVSIWTSVSLVPSSQDLHANLHHAPKFYKTASQTPNGHDVLGSERYTISNFQVRNQVSFTQLWQ